MIGRRPLAVLLLVAMLSALALSAGLEATGEERPLRSSRGDAAFTPGRWSGLDAAVIRLKPGELRDPGTAQRFPKGGLVLLAVLAMSPALSVLAPRGSVPAASATISYPACRSPISGRAPPRLQPAVH